MSREHVRLNIKADNCWVRFGRRFDGQISRGLLIATKCFSAANFLMFCFISEKCFIYKTEPNYFTSQSEFIVAS